MATTPIKSAAPSPKAQEGLEVTNVRPSLVQCAGLRFLPGDTKMIPPEHVDAVRRSPLFGRVLVEGRPAMPEPTPIAKPSTLESEDDPRALAFVNVETDLATLAAWAEAESGGPKRANILEAISKRAADLASRK